jgi:hypothetical protein
MVQTTAAGQRDSGEKFGFFEALTSKSTMNLIMKWAFQLHKEDQLFQQFLQLSIQLAIDLPRNGNVTQDFRQLHRVACNYRLIKSLKFSKSLISGVGWVM